MHKETKEELGVRFKLVVLEHANHFGVIKTCREFNVYPVKTSSKVFYSRNQ